MTFTQHDKADVFRALHMPGKPLVLANAWDVASARITESAGVAAASARRSATSSLPVPSA